MSNSPKYCLTLSALFSNEEDLLSALKIFRSWCETHKEPGKKYGMVKTGPIRANLFLISTESIPTWTLHYLFVGLEFGSHVIIEKSDSSPVG